MRRKSWCTNSPTKKTSNRARLWPSTRNIFPLCKTSTASSSASTAASSGQLIGRSNFLATKFVARFQFAPYSNSLLSFRPFSMPALYQAQKQQGYTNSTIVHVKSARKKAIIVALPPVQFGQDAADTLVFFSFPRPTLPS